MLKGSLVFITFLIFRQIGLNLGQDETGHSLFMESNCTQQQLQEIDKCNLFYPVDFLNISQSPIMNGNGLIFAQKSRLESLNRTCDSFEKYTKCVSNLSLTTLACLENLIDLEKTDSFVDYLCKKMRPLAIEPNFAQCWKMPCRLTEQSHHKQDTASSPRVCLLLDSIDTQLNCALDQTTPCSKPSQDTLRSARSETASLVDKFACDEATTGESDNANDRISNIPGKSSPRPQSGQQGTRCSQKQNSDADICLKELWGINKYMGELSNGSFWPSVLGNNSNWRAICKQCQAHQECLEEKMIQDGNTKLPCLFDVQMHNFATFIQILCDDEVLNKDLSETTCKADVKSMPKCSVVSDFINGNFSLISDHNSSKAFCDLFSTPAAYFTCMTESFKPCQREIQKVYSSIQEYSTIMGCASRRSSVTAELVQNMERDTQDTTTIPNGALSCSEQTSTQCDEINFNPITVARDIDSVNANFCSIYTQVLDSCNRCNMNNSTFSVESIYAYVCGPGLGNFMSLKTCLRSLAENPIVKSCLSKFFLDFSEENSCETITRLLNCSYSLVDEQCGEIGAEFHINILHNLAVNSDSSCRLPNFNSSESESIDRNSVLTLTNCDDAEVTKMEQCEMPFRKLLRDLEGSGKGGISGIISTLKNVSTVVKQGCAYRENFYHCVKNNLKADTLCSISSCMVKVGDTACSDNVTGKEIERRVRCLFTLVTDPKFQLCARVFPKNAFSSLSKLKKYIPPFLDCLKDSILKKCGDQSWQLAKVFATNKNDSSCELEIENLSWSSIAPMAKTEPEPLTETPNVTSEKNHIESDETSLGSIFNRTMSPCTMEILNRFEDCSNVLGDQKPQPIMIFDDSTKLDQACRLFGNYKACLNKYNCFYPLAEFHKSLLFNVCTIYYDSYKANAACLKRSAVNSKVATCIRKFQSIDLRSTSANLGNLGCQSISDLLKCAGDTVDLTCGIGALDLLYKLYGPASQRFLSNCTPNRTDIGPPMTECTRDEREVYYKCRAMVPINPVSFANSSLELNQTCVAFGDQFQSCLARAPCIPQPAQTAFNDTMSYLCYAELNRRDFDRYGPCLIQLASTDSGQKCAKMFYQITWDDPGKAVCRKLNQVMDCIYPLIHAKCQPDTLIFTYQVFATMAYRYRAGCQLNVPPQVQMIGNTFGNNGPPPEFVTRLGQPSLNTTSLPLSTTTKWGVQISVSPGALAGCLIITFVSLLMY